MRAIKLSPSGSIELLTDDTALKYPAINARLFGEDQYGTMIEQVTAYHLAEEFGRTHGYPNVLMLINENGLALELPYNPNATVLYAPEKPQAFHRGGNLAIVGDAFLIGSTWSEEGWDWADLPDTVNVADVKALVTRVF